MKENVNCFYHGTGEYLDSAISNMHAILETGFIRSKNNLEEFQGIDLGPGLFNGRNYISLTAWDESVNHDVESFDSAFNGWIFGCPFLVISNDIDAVHCKRIASGQGYNSKIDRVSQFLDEWHVEGEISIDHVLGIALPMDAINEDIKLGFIEAETVTKLERIIQIAKERNWFILEQSDELAVQMAEERVVSMNKHK